jgi:hypothetical protein
MKCLGFETSAKAFAGSPVFQRWLLQFPFLWKITWLYMGLSGMACSGYSFSSRFTTSSDVCLFPVEV